MPGMFFEQRGCGLLSRGVMRDAFDAAADRRVRAFVMIWCAAIAIACKPEEQKRLTVVPATEPGRPASIAETARDVVPLRAVRLAAAENDVVDLGGIELRRLAQTSLMQCAARSSGRVMLNEPRNDLASAFGNWRLRLLLSCDLELSFRRIHGARALRTA